MNAFENFLATTGIAPLGIPLAAPDGAAWAILNLILALLGVVLCVGAFVRRASAGRRTEADGPAPGESAGEDERRRRAFVPMTLAALAALATILLFLATEDITLSAAWLDRYTPPTVVLFAIGVACLLWARAAGRSKREDGLGDEPAGVRTA